MPEGPLGTVGYSEFFNPGCELIGRVNCRHSSSLSWPALTVPGNCPRGRRLHPRGFQSSLLRSDKHVEAARKYGLSPELPEIAGQDRHRSSTICDVASYTFGDDEPAVERLRLVASAYDPISRAFLAAHVASGIDVAIDLGCGPGFSTQLLHEVCAPHTLIGVDSSSQFLEVARARLRGAVFETHDVTATPLPGAPASVIYARLVLAHIPDPLGTVDRWKGQLPLTDCSSWRTSRTSAHHQDRCVSTTTSQPTSFGGAADSCTRGLSSPLLAAGACRSRCLLRLRPGSTCSTSGGGSQIRPTPQSTSDLLRRA